MARKDVKKTTKQAAVPEKASAVAAAVTGQTLTLVEELKKSVSSAYTQYLKDLEQDQKLRLVDTFLAFLVVGVFQFSFCLLGGSYPFNAFLSGFSATVGQFVLTVALRLQSTPENTGLFSGLLPERAFGEYVLASLVLHFVLIHFIN